MDQLKQKFSLGLPVQSTIAEFTAFIDDYACFIHDVYTSPIGDKSFHSRNLLAGYLSAGRSNEKYFYSCLEYLNKKNIKVNIAYNTPMLDMDSVARSLGDVRRKIRVDGIVTLDKFYGVCRDLFPDAGIIYSYNNGIATIDDLPDNRYDAVVLGGRHIRNCSLFTRARERGLKVKVMLDNGCLFNCPGVCFGKGNTSCKRRERQNIATCGVNTIYAAQSIMPWELHQHYIGKKLVDYYKVCSRTAVMPRIRRQMQTYIENINRPESIYDYLLWGKFRGPADEDLALIDIEMVRRIKEMIWESTWLQETWTPF